MGTLSSRRRKVRSMNASTITWFLVADGSQAQIYVRQRLQSYMPLAGNAKHAHVREYYEPELVPVAGMLWKASSLEEYDIDSQVPGKVFESASPTRHTSAPHTNIREKLKLRFMHTIAEHLKTAHQQKSFDRLVLIAPPKLLGELKKQLDSSVLDHVIAELPKELTRYKGRELAEQLEDIVR